MFISDTISNNSKCSSSGIVNDIFDLTFVSTMYTTDIEGTSAMCFLSFCFWEGFPWNVHNKTPLSPTCCIAKLFPSHLLFPSPGYMRVNRHTLFYPPHLWIPFYVVCTVSFSLPHSEKAYHTMAKRCQKISFVYHVRSYSKPTHNFEVRMR